MTEKIKLIPGVNLLDERLNMTSEGIPGIEDCEHKVHTGPSIFANKDPVRAGLENMAKQSGLATYLLESALPIEVSVELIGYYAEYGCSSLPCERDLKRFLHKRKIDEDTINSTVAGLIGIMPPDFAGMIADEFGADSK